MTNAELWAIIHQCRDELRKIECHMGALRLRQSDYANKLTDAYEQLASVARLRIELTSRRD